MLSDQQRIEFEQSGVVALRGAVRPQVAAEMVEHIWGYLADHGIHKDDPDAPSRILPSKVRGAVRQQSFERMWGEPVRDAVDSILGPDRWKVPGTAGQLLVVTYPNAGPYDGLMKDGLWAVPSKVWHLDYKAPGWMRGLPGVQMFLCLDDVEPHSGATLGIAGSHRLVDRIRRAEGPEFEGRSADVRRLLRSRVPWYRELCSERPDKDRIARFMDQTGEFEDVQLRVVEFSGAAGDVIVMHPWIVHTASANCGTRPRMVLTERIYARYQPKAAQVDDVDPGQSDRASA